MTWTRLYHRMFVGLWLHKNHYRLIAINLSWQKELDANPKSNSAHRICYTIKRTT